MEINIHNLKKKYGKNIVLDIPNLTFNTGELIGIVGNNGAGKTTLMRLILDLISANDGEVRSDGKLVTITSDWKLYTGSYIDKSFLIDFYTAEEYFEFIAKAYGIDSPTLSERLEIFKPLMRDDILGKKKYLHDFSEGNRQKIGIIGAMLIQPKVLILDEPFNYLDPSSQIIIAKLIQKFNKEQNATVLISSHNLNFISEISSRIILLEKGKIIKDIQNQGKLVEKEIEDYFQEIN